MPSTEKAGMPPTYSVWQACRRNKVLWWSGGLSNQPFVLMQEFAVYDDVKKTFRHSSSVTTRPVLPKSE